MRRTGFTLLEVVLALALTALVLGALGLAIQVNLRATDTGRADVARAQLGRAVLRQIADDLRAAVWYEPPDVASLASAGGSAAGNSSGSNSTGGSGAPAGSGGQSAGGPGSGGTPAGGSSPSTSGSSTTGGESAQSAGSTESLGLPEKPGLYGGRDWLEVDVSRLPRVDQYQPAQGSVAGASGDLTSDIKTVAYYLASSPYAPAAATAGGSGLWRREVDRAVTIWAVANGNSSGLNQGGEPLAAEVSSLELSYYDGTEWLTEWDSSELGGLPLAVEIVVGIDLTPELSTATRNGLASTTAADPDIATFHLLVHLPVAQPLDSAGAAGEASDSGNPDSSSTSGSGSSSSGSAGSASSGGGSRP